MAEENIFREVDEELRSDRLRAFWRRFGPFVIGAAVAVVLLVAANEGYNWWRSSNSAKSSDQLYTAFDQVSAGKIDDAQKTLDQLIANGTGGYPMLARFKQASLLARQGKTDQAVAAYDKLSSSESDSEIRSLALILAANLLVDKGDVSGVETRVGGLLATGNPLRDAAHEALGLANYKAGKLDEAVKQFQAVIDDPNSPQDMQGRMQIYIGQLESEGAKPPAQPTPAATGSSDKAAPASNPAPQPAGGQGSAPAPSTATPDKGTATPGAARKAAPASGGTMAPASPSGSATPSSGQ